MITHIFFFFFFSQPQAHTYLSKGLVYPHRAHHTAHSCAHLCGDVIINVHWDTVTVCMTSVWARVPELTLYPYGDTYLYAPAPTRASY